MDKTLKKQSIIVWLSLTVLAIINGTIRNEFYQPIIGDLRAHQVSTIIFIAVIFAVTYIFLKKTKAQVTEKDAISIGALWLSITVIFEFIFGHYIAGHSWEKLLADYDITQGRIWILILITTLIAPYAISVILNRKNRSAHT